MNQNTNSSPAASTPPARSARRPGRDPEARLARNLERADDLDYRVLWLRTADARMLRSMLYPFDRACQRIRATMASLQLPLAEGREALETANRLLDRIDAVVPPTSTPGSQDGAPGGEGSTIANKQALRAWRRAIAGEFGVDFYLPRSPEGARLTEALPRLDAKLLQARNSAISVEDADQLLTQTAEVIRETHETVTRLAALARIDYEPPRQLKPRATRAWGATPPVLTPAGEPTGEPMPTPAEAASHAEAEPASAPAGERDAEDRPRTRRLKALSL